MFRQFQIAPLALFCGLVACAPTQPPQTGAIAIGRTFGEGTVTFENQSGSMAYVYTIANFSGFLAVCGSYAIEGPVGPNVARELLSQLRFFVDERAVHRGFGHFSQVNDAEELKNRPAQCARTATPWSQDLMEGDWDVDLQGTRRITV